MCVGGIVGVSQSTQLINCLSTGEIRSLNTSVKYVGSIQGLLDTNTNINHCYYTSNTGQDLYGGIQNENSITVSDSNLVELNETTLKTLNDCAEPYSLTLTSTSLKNSRNNLSLLVNPTSFSSVDLMGKAM